MLCSRPNAGIHIDWIEKVSMDSVIAQYQFLLVLYPELSMNPYAYQYEKIEKQVGDIVTNWKKYNAIYDRLGDKTSKQLLEKILEYRLTYNPMLHKDIATIYPHYFDKDIVSIGEEEIFVDCGGYNGDTLRSFMDLTDGKFAKYYLFEPDSRLIEEARNSARGDARVTFINKGVWDSDAELVFQPENSSGNGTIVMDNNAQSTINVPVTSIDNNVDHVTFIKMDVEGSEYHALEGAKRLISEDCPVMAICIYHKYEDIIELYDEICRIGNYRFYIRAQYNNIDMELYYLCIPIE